MCRPAGRQHVVLRDADLHALGPDLDRAAALDGVGQALEADPAARVARQREAVAGRGRGSPARSTDSAPGCRSGSAPARSGARSSDDLAPGSSPASASTPPCGDGAGVVAVLQRVARSGRRRVPCRTRCRRRRRSARRGRAAPAASPRPPSRRGPRSRRARSGRRCAASSVARLPQRHVVGAERRAAVAGDEARRAQARPRRRAGAAAAAGARAPGRRSGRRARTRARSGRRAGSSRRSDGGGQVAAGPRFPGPGSGPGETRSIVPKTAADRSGGAKVDSAPRTWRRGWAPSHGLSTELTAGRDRGFYHQVNPVTTRARFTSPPPTLYASCGSGARSCASTGVAKPHQI